MAEAAFLYGADRVRRIRIALGVAIGLGVICGMFAVLLGGAADERRETVGAIILGVIAAVVILASVLTWRLLDAPDRAAKRAVVVTGVLMILFALFTFPIGLLFVVLGMVLIFLALISDEGSGT